MAIKSFITLAPGNKTVLNKTSHRFLVTAKLKPGYPY